MTCWWPCAELPFSPHAETSYSNHTPPLLTRITPKLWLSVPRYQTNSSLTILTIQTCLNRDDVFSFSLWHLHFTRQKQNYERLEQALDGILLIKTMGQVLFSYFHSQITLFDSNLRAGKCFLDGWIDDSSRCSRFQGPYSEIKKQMDKRDPLAHPLLMWWVAPPGLEGRFSDYALDKWLPALLKIFRMYVFVCLTIGFYPATNRTLWSFHKARYDRIQCS